MTCARTSGIMRPISALAGDAPTGETLVPRAAAIVLAKEDTATTRAADINAASTMKLMAIVLYRVAAFTRICAAELATMDPVTMVLATITPIIVHSATG